jgi:hypothetical protein
MNSTSGSLTLPSGDEGNSQDYRLSVVELFKEGKILEARSLLCNSVRPDEMDDIFRWMYDNLDLWATEQEKQDKAILIIRDGLVNHTLVSDPEINLSATLCELTGMSE